MEWVEITGKTVEEAKEAALDELGVDEHDAEFEILEEPRAGLFGRLRSEARVRARVLPTAPAPKAGRRERRRNGRARSSGGSGTAPPSRVSTEGSRREAGHEGGDVAGMGEQESAASADPEEVAQVALSFLEGLLQALGVGGELGWRQNEDETIEVAVGGGDLGLLIGHRGQTLAAVQDLTRTVVQRRVSATHPRVVVDIGSYRERRRDALTRFARDVADQVVESGVPAVLEPMVPADRKVVHDTVAAIEGVSTTSEGEEPNRRIVIVPEPRGG